MSCVFDRRQAEEERLRQQKLREVEERERALKEQEERWRRERQEEDDRCAVLVVVSVLDIVKTVCFLKIATRGRGAVAACEAAAG